MQAMAKRIIILCFVLIAGMIVKAQSFTASYKYDANGNRYLAQVNYLLKSTHLAPDQPNILSVDTTTKCVIKVYPTPAHNDLMLEIAGVTPQKLSSQSNPIQIVNLQGKIVLEIPTVSSFNQVDISNLASGIYILRIRLNEKVWTYKIVKD